MPVDWPMKGVILTSESLQIRPMKLIFLGKLWGCVLYFLTYMWSESEKDQWFMQREYLNIHVHMDMSANAHYALSTHGNHIEYKYTLLVRTDLTL